MRMYHAHVVGAECGECVKQHEVCDEQESLGSQSVRHGATKPCLEEHLIGNFDKAKFDQKELMDMDCNWEVASN